jgi:putative sigma-54 modulation protein
MRTNVVGRHLEVTDAIRAHAEKKCEKLVRHLNLIQQITVRVEPDPHKKGFSAEVVCDVEHHEDFVAQAHHDDLYTAIDHAVEKCDGQVSKFKERLKGT